MVEGYKQETGESFFSLKDVSTEYPLYNGAVCSGAIAFNENAPQNSCYTNARRSASSVQSSGL